VTKISNSATEVGEQKYLDSLLTAQDVARVAGLSLETLAQWRSQLKGIPFVKLSRNVVRYRQADLDSWIEERTVTVRQDGSSTRSHG
jgi:predicted DNA-binding transcriptional regulator AlpA